MGKVRRINLVSGAGAGKSLTAYNLRSQLGFKGYNAELVEEVIKDWTYTDRVPCPSDQLYLLSCQLKKEEIRLNGGVDVIVNECPSILPLFYSTLGEYLFRDAMGSAVMEFERLYPSIYIFLEREDKFYSEVGRFQNLEEAKIIDESMRSFLLTNLIDYRTFSCLEQDEIIDYVISELK
jgi:hypothetical protein